MILDYETIFMEAQSPVDTSGSTDITTGTSISVNVLDTGPRDADNSTIDFAAGQDWFFFFLVTTEADSAADGASVNVRLVSSAAATLGTPTVHYQTGVLVEATFAVGYTLKIRPAADQNWLRYVGVDFLITGENLTAFACTALLTDRVDVLRQYAIGTNTNPVT